MSEESQQPQPIPGLGPGRIVHYVLTDHDLDNASAGEVRPAMVIQVWDTTTGCSNLTVFIDMANDVKRGGDPVAFDASSIHYDEAGSPGTWHFPPRV